MGPLYDVLRQLRLDGCALGGTCGTVAGVRARTPSRTRTPPDARPTRSGWSGTGPERVCGTLAGENRAIISAHIEAERERVGRDPNTGKFFDVVWGEYVYHHDYLTLSQASKIGGSCPSPRVRPLTCEINLMHLHASPS